MPAFREGKVVRLIEERDDLTRAEVALESGDIEAVGFPKMLGPLEPGDRVIVNTTGLELGLGTGGIGFILWNLDGTAPPPDLRGHIVKLRYTPWQTEVLSAEEPDGPYHDTLEEIGSIDGMPVVACSLHSQIAGVAAGIKAARPEARVGYLMTDGASLPIAWSDLVRDLRSAGLIDSTCTCGHAFGGDLETVNEFSGLAALRSGAGMDVVVVAMGPGVVGTGTRLGHTALEQGQILDAVAALGGRGIACLRITFADPRLRHTGVSHHALTALRIVAHRPCIVAIPELSPEQSEVVAAQIADAGIGERHELQTVDGSPGLRLLAEKGLAPTSMGRTVEEIPELFGAAAAAGRIAAEML
jgi:hypothetical protein